MRGKTLPFTLQSTSLKDGGRIDTTTTTTDELPRDFEEQQVAAAKRNRYAFMREYLSSPLSALTLSFLLARESNRMDCLSVFRPAKVHYYSHIAFLFLSLSNRKTTTTKKNGVHAARVYITIRTTTTTTDDDEDDGFGGGADSWEKDANDADEE